MAEKKNSGVPVIGESQTKKRRRLSIKSEWSPVSKVPKPVNREELGIEQNQILNGRYKVVDKLGQGTYGQVWQCWDYDTERHVAVKACRGSTDRRMKAAWNEIRNLRRLAKVKAERPRFVEMLEYFDYRDNMCIVLEKLGLSLFEVIEINYLSPFPMDHIRKFGAQILESVARMHELELIHADLKPDNVLLVSSEARRYTAEPMDERFLPESCDIKLIDFGSTHPGHKTHLSAVTTSSFRAPEVILGLGWTYPCDIWSIGCLLFQLSTGSLLFKVDDDLEHLAMMVRVLGPLPEQMVKKATLVPYEHFSQGRVNLQDVSPNSRVKIGRLSSLEARVWVHVESSRSGSFVDLLKGLLKYDPDERLTARAALDHPFFKNPT